MMLEGDPIGTKTNHLRFKILQISEMYYQDIVAVTIKGQEMELVKILTTFTSIDLSQNNFEGEIPKELGDLKALHVLNLSFNAFTGQIPSSLGYLSQLESLDLSLNKLSGRIPPEIANLNFLSYCNFSFNQLVGKMPSSTQLQTFSASSFMGNKGLCGPPLASCPNSDSDPPSFSPQSLNFGTEIDWKYVSSSLGFVVGLGFVTVPLLIWQRWRIFFFYRIDMVLQGVLSKMMEVRKITGNSGGGSRTIAR